MSGKLLYLKDLLIECDIIEEGGSDAETEDKKSETDEKPDNLFSSLLDGEEA
jgi:hypothetical protein